MKALVSFEFLYNIKQNEQAIILLKPANGLPALKYAAIVAIKTMTLHLIPESGIVLIAKHIMIETTMQQSILKTKAGV